MYLEKSLIITLIFNLNPSPMRVQVKDFMSAPVVTTTTDSDVAYARELMERKNVSAIPVVDLGEKISVRGIVTRHDICGVSDESTPVVELMTNKILTVSSDTSAQAAANRMLRNQVHHLVVMEEDRIVGMLSSMDFVRLVAEQQVQSFGGVIFV